MSSHYTGPNNSQNPQPNQPGQPQQFNQPPQQPGPKKLVRSTQNRYIAGVCGGIAETYNIDPTIVRLIFVALALAGMSGVLVYIICWIVIPNAQQY